MNGSAYTLNVVLLGSLFQLRSIVASLTVDCHMSQSLNIIYKKACFFLWKIEHNLDQSMSISLLSVDYNENNENER